MQRFYKAVSVDPIPEGGFRVALDGRELRSPAKRPLHLPTRALAEALAAEWGSQKERIDVRTMPLMALSSTAADRVGPMRAQIVAEVARFAETDLVCYRAGEPESLVRRQEHVWQPLLDWLAMRYDARLETQFGILPKQQSREALNALRLAVDAYGDAPLAALSSVTATTGSLVIGLAFLEGRVDAEDAAAASQLDERFQAETWGDDPEAAAQRAAQAGEIAAARRFVDLLA